MNNYQERIALENQVRQKGMPTAETKLRIYGPLINIGSLRLVDAMKICGYGNNRTTPWQCFKHGIVEGEVRRDRITKAFSITPKGIGEYHRLVTENRIKTAYESSNRGAYYSETLESPSQLKEPPISSFGFWAELTKMMRNPPIPVPVEVKLYNSERASFESARDLAHYDYPELGPMKLVEAILKEKTDGIAWKLMTAGILDRVNAILDLHRYEKKRTTGVGGNPILQLSLESILGFDMTLIMNYEGSKLVEKSSYPRVMVEQARLAHRLAGMLLLIVAHEGLKPPSKRPKFIGRRGRRLLLNDMPSDYDMVPLMRRGGIITEQDAATISRGGILKVAIGHLIEGGLLKLPSNETLEHVSREAAKMHSRPLEPGLYYLPQRRDPMKEKKKAQLAR